MCTSGYKESIEQDPPKLIIEDCKGKTKLGGSPSLSRDQIDRSARAKANLSVSCVPEIHFHQVLCMFLRRLFTQQQPVLRQLGLVTLRNSVSSIAKRAQRHVLTFQAI
jgi:hypothetical protein